jgi:hypothetical protein
MRLKPTTIGKLAKIPIITIASNNSNIVNAPILFDFNI